MKGNGTMAANDTQVKNDAPAIEDVLIRDLVEAYPETMEVLGPLGIDLCCGGGHPLGEALDLHGFDRAEILPQVVRVVEASSAPQR
jgi:regulator of cell morphogenesis and NO signaling